MKTKFGIITYEKITYSKTNLINVGDYVQSIAARQFLPQVDTFISREGLKQYNGDDVKMIMNAWFMANPNNFPPSAKINPLYVSIHINSKVKNGMTTPECIEHFKKHEPIGCRDEYTRDLLIAKGVDAYFSGCLTLTLGKTYKRNKPTDKVYIVDVMFDSLSLPQLINEPLRLAKRILNGRIKEHNWRKNILNNFFTKELLNEAEYITQLADDVPASEGFVLADKYLKMLCNAKLVITSRIHCALPCLAMGVPVIFIYGGFDLEMVKCRFGGITDFFNRIDVDKNGKGYLSFSNEGKIGLNTDIVNPNRHLNYASSMAEICTSFVNE